MKVREAREQDKWALFGESAIQQTLTWGAVYSNNNYIRLIVENEEEEIVAYCIGLLVQSKLFRYVKIVDGPIIYDKQDILVDEILKQIALYIKQNIRIADFIVLQPSTPDSEQVKTNILKQGFIKSPRDLQYRDSILLNLSDTEYLLKNTSESCRYEIRRYSKETEIWEATSTDIEEFYTWLKETSKKNNFSIMGVEKMKKLIEVSKESPEIDVKLYYLIKDSKPIAGCIVGLHNDRAYYLYASRKNIKIPFSSSRLLIWKVIEKLSAEDVKELDLFGIDKAGKKGYTTFKREFGGKEYNNIGTFIFPLNPIKTLIYRAVLLLFNIRDRLN